MLSTPPCLFSISIFLFAISVGVSIDFGGEGRGDHNRASPILVARVGVTTIGLILCLQDAILKLAPGHSQVCF